MFAAGSEVSVESGESAGPECRWQEIAVSSESHLCTCTINYKYVIVNYFIDKYNHVIDDYNNVEDNEIYLF